MTRRVPSPSDSQDSFACDLDNRPEERYLARSDKFALPLSELGKRSLPIRVSANVTGSSLYHMERSPSPGRILVEATPSHSGSSQHDEPLNLSQQLEATQLVDDNGEVIKRQNDIRRVDKDGNGSGYESSEPSSSYRRFLDGERDPGHQMQATQPSTQIDDSTGGPISEDAIPWSNLRTVPHPSASSAPQSLLSMVPPGNRWRYRQYLHPASGAAGNGGLPSTVGQTNSSRDRRTPTSFPASTIVRSIPPAPNTARDMRPRIPPPSPIHPDAMDVVPDSEPITHEEIRTTKLPALPPPSLHRTKNPMKDDNDMELDLPEANLRIGHRMEEEEEEEEIPLASLTGRPGKNTIATKGNVLTNMPPPGRMPAKVRYCIFTYCRLSFLKFVSGEVSYTYCS